LLWNTGAPDGTKLALANYPATTFLATAFNREKSMKRFIVCTAVLGLAFSSAAQAKGCIKGAIAGGVAGSLAGHGKVGAVAGCVIGRHEANKADTEKANPQTPASIAKDKADGRI
jgi:hypothetical protein